MKSISKVLINLIFLIFALNANAQKSTFIIHHDSVYQQGTFNNEYLYNTKEIQFKEGPHEEYKTFKADVVNQCNISGDVILKGLPIDVNGTIAYRLLQLLVSGETNLYVLNEKPKRFFIEKGPQLIEIYNDGENSIQNQLSENLDLCEVQKKSIRFIKYKKGSLSRVISNYNNKNCLTYIRPSFGLTGGMGNVIFNIKEYSPPFNYYDGSKLKDMQFFFGAFADLPVHRVNRLSLLNELTFHKQSFAVSEDLESYDRDFIIEFSNLQYSFLPKYTTLGEKVRWHIGIGPSALIFIDTFSDMFIANKNEAGVSFQGNNEIIIFPTYQIGVSGTTGVQVFYNSKNYLSLDLKIDNHWEKQSYSLNYNSIILRLNI